MTEGRRLIVGIGNSMRRDDGAGPAVAARLAARGHDAIEHAGDAIALIALWRDVDDVVLIDAMRSGAAPGTVRRFDALGESLPRDGFPHTSHVLGLVEAVETARHLGRLPNRLTVYGIEAADFGYGDGLSPEVARAVGKCARCIEEVG